MSTHVYVLQRPKALGDGENEVTILHWTLWESALNAYCSEVYYNLTFFVWSIYVLPVMGFRESRANQR